MANADMRCRAAERFTRSTMDEMRCAVAPASEKLISAGASEMVTPSPSACSKQVPLNKSVRCLGEAIPPVSIALATPGEVQIMHHARCYATKGTLRVACIAYRGQHWHNVSGGKSLA